MEWGGVCNLLLPSWPMLSYLIPLSFFVLPQSVNPSLSVSHTCTNADFDLELAGSSQWLRGAQGGGLWSWNCGQKQVLHHSNSPLHLELRSRLFCMLSFWGCSRGDLSVCFWCAFLQVTGSDGSESPWIGFKGETERELDSQVQERRAHAGQYRYFVPSCLLPRSVSAP